MNKIILPVILGPTGVGKTELAIEIALKINAEIVSCDSRQIYKYMDIGTSKPTAEQIMKISHWFISIITPDVPYNAYIYAKEAHKKIKEIVKNGKIPLVVGGAGLYLRALIEGFFEVPESTVCVEADVIQGQKQTTEKLYEKLMKVDKLTALKLHPNDRMRIVRSLEIYEITGMPISKLRMLQSKQDEYEPIYIGLTMERDVLYKRIEERVDKMITKGLVKEVKNIIDRGYSAELPSLQTIGYKEVADYLSGKLSLEKAVKLIKQNSRRYAKRQITWFKHIKNVYWLQLPDPIIVRKCIKIISQLVASQPS